LALEPLLLVRGQPKETSVLILYLGPGQQRLAQQLQEQLHQRAVEEVLLQPIREYRGQMEVLVGARQIVEL
jgi:hypothetical protein